MVIKLIIFKIRNVVIYGRRILVILVALNKWSSSRPPDDMTRDAGEMEEQFKGWLQELEPRNKPVN